MKSATIEENNSGDDAPAAINVAPSRGEKNAGEGDLALEIPVFGLLIAMDLV